MKTAIFQFCAENVNCCEILSTSFIPAPDKVQNVLTYGLHRIDKIPYVAEQVNWL